MIPDFLPVIILQPLSSNPSPPWQVQPNASAEDTRPHTGTAPGRTLLTHMVFHLKTNFLATPYTLKQLSAKDSRRAEPQSRPGALAFAVMRPPGSSFDRHLPTPYNQPAHTRHEYCTPGPGNRYPSSLDESRLFHSTNESGIAADPDCPMACDLRRWHVYAPVAG